MRAQFITWLIRVAFNPVQRRTNTSAGLTGLTGLTGSAAHVCVCNLFQLLNVIEFNRSLAYVRLTLLTLLTLLSTNIHAGYSCTGLSVNRVNPC